MTCSIAAVGSISACHYGRTGLLSGFLRFLFSYEIKYWTSCTCWINSATWCRLMNIQAGLNGDPGKASHYRAGIEKLKSSLEITSS